MVKQYLHLGLYEYDSLVKRLPTSRMMRMCSQRGADYSALPAGFWPWDPEGILRASYHLLSACFSVWLVKVLQHSLWLPVWRHKQAPVSTRGDRLEAEGIRWKAGLAWPLPTARPRLKMKRTLLPFPNYLRTRHCPKLHSKSLSFSKSDILNVQLSN